MTQSLMMCCWYLLIGSVKLQPSSSRILLEPRSRYQTQSYLLKARMEARGPGVGPPMVHAHQKNLRITERPKTKATPHLSSSLHLDILHLLSSSTQIYPPTYLPHTLCIFRRASSSPPKSITGQLCRTNMVLRQIAVSHFRSLIFLWFCSHLVELVSKLSHGSWWLASKAQRLHSRLQHLSQMTSHCQVLDQGTVRAVFAPVRRWCVIHNNCCCETVSHVHVVCNELFPLVLIEKASTM